MLDDFTPIVHQLDGRTIRLYPIGDTHIGAKESDLDGINKFVESIKSDDDAYVLILGDILNNGLRSASCPTNPYEETMPPSAQIDYAVRLFQPIADKILGCVGGNHERRSIKEVGLDPLYAVCSMLRRKDGSTLQDIYRPNMAFIRFNLSRNGVKDHYAVMITHGKTLNKRKQFSSIVEGIDACIFAHTHTPDVMFAPSRIRFNQRNVVSVHHVISLCACSWLKAGGYSLSGLLTPQITSRPQCLELEFTGSNSRRGQIRIAW